MVQVHHLALYSKKEIAMSERLKLWAMTGLAIVLMSACVLSYAYTYLILWVNGISVLP